MERSSQPLVPNGGAVDANLHLDVWSQVEDVGVARHAISAFLLEQGVPTSIVDDFELVVSELVTNAIQHGDGGPIRLDASADEHVVLSVASAGAPGSIPPVGRWSLPEPYAASGRGLAIVHRLCDEVDVREDGHLVVVLCRRRLPDGGGVR